MRSCLKHWASLAAMSAFLAMHCADASRSDTTERTAVYVATYQRGPAWTEGTSVRELPVFQQHLAHLRAIEANLLGAGPFAGAESDKTVGMIIFLAASDAEARGLAGSDPFVQAHYTRVMTVLRWEIDKLKPWQEARYSRLQGSSPATASASSTSAAIGLNRG
jgi:uncharacterized protein YciI